MIKVRILSDKLSVLKGTGKLYEMHIRTAYAYTVNEAAWMAIADFLSRQYLQIVLASQSRESKS